MSLTANAVRAAKSAEKPRKLYDGRGLYLLIMPNGSRLWRFKYCFGGKENLLSLGSYPEISLADARTKRDELRIQIAKGINPGAVRQAEKAAQAGEGTFEALAREWFGQFSSGWSPNHSTRVWRRLEVDLIPWLGARAAGEISAPELLATVRRIQARGALETAHRALQTCSQIFRYGVATGRAVRDPAADLRGALPPVRVQHFAALTDPKAIGDLIPRVTGLILPV